MKKQHLFIILFVVLLGFVFGVVQYYQALKTEDVSAVTVGLPNPGHSLAQLECSANSLCVDTVNNRVGIGTNNPATTLDVVGNISTSQGIRLNTASGDSLPTCNIGIRGTIWVVSSNSGVGDTVYICLKNSGDVYAWKSMSEIQRSFSCGDVVSFIYNGNSVTYGTILSSTGKCFMDRNIGASQVATGYADSAAYGDLFQQGRAPDGHQLINRTTGVPVYSTTSTISDFPNNSLFIVGAGGDLSWRITRDYNLWQLSTSNNNPCPTGWRVPTLTEWQNEIAAGITNAPTAYSLLKLTLAGDRVYGDSQGGKMEDVGVRGQYWSSTYYPSGSYHGNLSIYADSASMAGDVRAYGLSVRCIRD
jgi:hypothetical protein